MIIKRNSSFERAYKKLSLDQQQQVDDTIRLFIAEPFHPQLRNHKLKGSQRGIRSISAAYDLRILYVEHDGHTIVIFIDVGTHDEVY